MEQPNPSPDRRQSIDTAESRTVSGELCAKVFRSSPESITVSQVRDGVFLEVNESFERMSGYRREEVIGRSSLDLSLWTEAPEDRVALAKELRAKGSVRDFPVILKTKRGEIMHCLMSAETLEHNGELCAVVITRDITDSERVQQALRASEERYRTLFDTASDAVFLMENDRFIDCNAATLTMFGRPRDEIVGNRPHDERLSPVCQPDGVLSDVKAREKIAAALDGKPLRFEWRHLRSDGTPFDSEVSVSRLETDGKAFLLAICRDISERKQAEEALRDSEEQYRSLVTNIPSVTWTADCEGRTTFISPNVESVYGYTPEEVYRGGPDIWFGRIHPEDVDRVMSAYAALLDSGAPFDVEYRTRKKSGDLIWLSDRATRTYDDQGVIRVDGVFSDITARKEAEAALLQAEYQYRHIFNSVADGLAILTMEGHFVEVNPAMCDLHGATREEHLSLTPARFLAPEEIPNFEESLENARLGASFHREALAQREDGRALNLEIRGTVFQYRGKPHILAIVRDITERKEAEARLRQVTEQLVEANATLEEKNIALRQILEHLEQDKKAYKHEVCESVEKLLLPVVARLKESGGTLDGQDIDVLETTLTAIVERDIDQFKSDLNRLTPRELDICDLIKEGCSSKDIAAQLHISSQTVHKHRQLIRRKLRLSNKAVNLAAYLRSR